MKNAPSYLLDNIVASSLTRYWAQMKTHRIQRHGNSFFSEADTANLGTQS